MSSHRCWVEIDLGALERNLWRIREALPPGVRTIAVVKADAYGHGLAQTATRLMRCGVDAFAVANLREAAALRELGSGWPILVLSALLPEEDGRLAEFGATAVVSSAGEVERFAAAARRAGKVLPVHLKIDTGMGRLGVWHTGAADLCARLLATPELRLEGVFTHFASADTDAAATAAQRGLFLRTVAALPVDPAQLLLHADNSAGLAGFAAGGPFNAVRVGLLQYGLAPRPGSLFERVRPEPVLSLHTRVGLVKEVPAGTPVSYNGTFVTARPTRLAVLTAGYADAIPTAASNRAQVLLGGRRCPVLGRVTMDQTIVDATDLPEPPRPGDPATLIGRQGAEAIGAAEFAAACQSIPYEVFCSLSQRVTRLYRLDTAV